MGSISSLKATLSDSLVSNSAVREAFDMASWATDRTTRLKNVVMDSEQKHRLRRILNHFLTPNVKPVFVDDEEEELDAVDRAPDSWLAKADDALKMPYRMIDVETKNMVPTYTLGMQDQYCIVSHSWKGSEIGYGYFDAAKKFDPMEDSQSDVMEPSNDLSRVINKCKADIRALEEKIESVLPTVTPTADGQRPKDIQTLLQWYTEANTASYDFGRAQRVHHDAAAGVSSAERETEYYNNLWGTLNALTTTEPSKEKAMSDQQDPGVQEVILAIESLNNDAKERRDQAEKKLAAASDNQAKYNSIIEFFEKNRELCYGIEQLLGSLQHMRSSRKISKSIDIAKELFDTQFLRGGKRYVWLDTCCINKADGGELTESLALMGDWYENADFCLVHVDTPRSEDTWIEEWKEWKNPSYSAVPENMETFEQIGAKGADEKEKEKFKIEWATRGWTLQELVLSKVTYYVNSHWKRLIRPVESIGPFYFLQPFLPQFFIHPFVEKHKEISDEQMEGLKKLLSQPSSKDGKPYLKEGMSTEQQLSVMLQILGFYPPNGIKAKTAAAQIGKAVLDAADRLPNTLNELMPQYSDTRCLAKLTSAKEDQNNRIAVFIYLLRLLRDATDTTILEDRKAIAEFSNIGNLTNWIYGYDLMDSSASTSLVTAADRVTTVATDQAYSLMGILGVRFPAFPAEGLPKALARLLDEVVISYNDVSVFNWYGKHHGSPLHGRSLYPSSIEAFVDPGTNASIKSRAYANQRILKSFRAQRVRQSETASHVNLLLAEMLGLTKKLPNDCSVFMNLGYLAAKIKETNFDRLETRLGDLAKVVEKLREFTPEDDSPGATSPTGLDRVNSLAESVRSAKFEVPKFEVPKFEVPKVSFGWKKSAAPSPIEKKPEEFPKAPVPVPEAPVDKFQVLNDCIEETIKVLNDADAPVTAYNAGLLLNAKTDTLNSLSESGDQDEEKREKRMVCPNPITVSSGGIRGIFDIQRVVVTMLEPKKLRSRVRTAVSGQKIDGWCTVSTGLAMALVSFSCERDQLQQQLDLSEVINKSIDPDETPADGDNPTPIQQNGKQTLRSQLRLEKTREKIRVARMISFVQKPNLDSVAGEWVLARFSGAPGAKWFLCLLELGAGNDFYGRRIPTDAFSFEDAAPEQGLTEYWHQFTTEKKARTCDTLDMYLNRQKLWKNAGANMHEMQKMQHTQEMQASHEKDEKDHLDWDMAMEIMQNLSLDTLEKTINLGKMTGYGIGGLGAELWAQHLESRIEKCALKRVPISLRTPVRDLDHNRKLLPAMFHAGREMHMF
ncbi:hypothetical protein N7520_011416 [Penicillium odoratum]|uniref:uncharacterized protein n=1 Tax=Penicillium odoratum TaxID=1167516 RepID=UPI002547F084|nr:uncharacterized protein N7520_011416 [Penicillium odoratum]KAJ5746234.1 hypothetical protein N7520_011416 [Penicillium odoratum]